jgi:hypothetical protein
MSSNRSKIADMQESPEAGNINSSTVIAKDMCPTKKK